MPLHTQKKSVFSKAVIFVTVISLCFQLVAAGTVIRATDTGDHTDAVLSVASPLSVSARSAILIEAQSGQVVWEKNADEILPMASTTKIMTALVAIENSNLEKTVEVSSDAVGIEGSSVYLYENERLSMEDLLYAMLLESANDAAAAIAIEVGGDIDSFADMMNKKAVELGLENTHFENPHGLDGDEHYTTARELGIIAAEAMKNPGFRTIVSTFKKTIPLNETEGVRLLINHNKMLKGYDGAVGVKTGYTKKSGRCLVSAAQRDGVELICVTLNAPDDWADHKKMLDYGLSKFESRTLCKEDDFLYIQPVVGGMEEYVMLKIDGDITVTVPRGCGDIDQTIELFRFSYAPIKKGDVMGRIVYTLDGEVISETPILASYSVDRIRYKKSLWDRITSAFAK